MAQREDARGGGAARESGGPQASPRGSEKSGGGAGVNTAALPEASAAHSLAHTHTDLTALRTRLPHTDASLTLPDTCLPPLSTHASRSTPHSGHVPGGEKGAGGGEGRRRRGQRRGGSRAGRGRRSIGGAVGAALVVRGAAAIGAASILRGAGR